MTDKNSLRKTKYVMTTIILSIAAMLWYRTSLFLPLNMYSDGESMAILCTLVIVLTWLGIAVTVKNRRNYINVIVNVLFPYQLYATATFREQYPSWINTVSTVTILLASAFFLVAVFRKITTKKMSKGAAIKRRLRHALLGARTIAVVCLCAVILPLSLFAFTDKEVPSSPRESVVYTQENEAGRKL